MAASAQPFVWYDLMTTDTDAAAKFYHDVVGWEASDAGIPNSPPYTLFSMDGGTPTCGLMPMADRVKEEGGGPRWLGHIGVEELEAFIARVKEAGGAIHRDPAEIPGIGRFAVAADPHGATFILFQSTAPMPASAASPVQSPGQVGWHELHAGDLEADRAFYFNVFGWTEAGDMDMGPMGMYRMFATGGAPAGGMMQKMPQTPVPGWQFYIVVDGVQAAVDRALAAGGSLLGDLTEVPGGSWIAVLFDPQGAVFALTGQHR